MTNHCCNEMKKHLLEKEVAISYIPKYREYGIKIKDGGTSMQIVKFCPWCGQKLPDSLSDQWLDELKKLGFKPGDSYIPSKYLSDEWWKQQNL